MYNLDLTMLFLAFMLTLINSTKFDAGEPINYHLLDDLIASYGLNNGNEITKNGQILNDDFIDTKRNDETNDDEDVDMLKMVKPEVEPRDEEYLEHSWLFGHQLMQGGAGEGIQRLKPDGSLPNMQVIKSDAILPAYCTPPNPCPLHYTSEDGCLEQFTNTAAFSREYQSQQQCMCDSEHMFNCVGSNDEQQLDTISRSLSNQPLDERVVEAMLQRNSHPDTESSNNQLDEDRHDLHKVVAKKYFTNKPLSPYLKGEPLALVAKKSPQLSRL